MAVHLQSVQGRTIPAENWIQNMLMILLSLIRDSDISKYLWHIVTTYRCKLYLMKKKTTCVSGMNSTDYSVCSLSSCMFNSKFSNRMKHFMGLKSHFIVLSRRIVVAHTHRWPVNSSELIHTVLSIFGKRMFELCKPTLVFVVIYYWGGIPIHIWRLILFLKLLQLFVIISNLKIITSYRC